MGGLGSTTIGKCEYGKVDKSIIFPTSVTTGTLAANTPLALTFNGV